MAGVTEEEERRSQYVATAHAVCDEVRKVVKGKDDIISLTLLAILARGHILLEDIPGVGKTTMALAFSRAMRLKYNRVQFTPDVMPSDVTGYTMYRRESDTAEYIPGAVLCNLFLADEINRTSSKTQSALLQVMEEGAVTVDLKTYPAPQPFTVIATQNPVGYAGTQLLPESQLDRFLIRLSMGYPDPESELEILKSKSGSAAPAGSAGPWEVFPVASAEEIAAMQKAVDGVHVDESIFRYIVSLCTATRQHELVELGVSPRGSIALLRMAKASAFYEGRSYVVPTNVRDVLLPALGHRILLKSRAKAANMTAAGLLEELLRSTPAPKIN